jgi:hypothetical protein
MPVMVALEALGLDTLTSEKFAVFKHIVVEGALLNKGICLLWCHKVNQQWPMLSSGF